jgi:hypothetical protein
VYGLDIARSLNRDRSVLAKRRGEEYLPYKIYRYDDTMKLVRAVADEANKEKPRAIFVDTCGLGGPVYDRLKEMGYPAIPVNSAETISMEFPERYNRLRDELWGKMRDRLEQGRCKLWDNEDGDLVGELSTPKSRIMAGNNKIQVESKDEVRARLKSAGGDEKQGSPDVADAHILMEAQPICNYNQDTRDDSEGFDKGPEMVDEKAGY